MTDTMTTELHAPYAAFREAALADGWTEIAGGVWGIQEQPLRMDPLSGTYASTGERRDGDRTVFLVKDDMKVWLVDRDIRGQRQTYTSGWFANGLQSMPRVPEVYDADSIEALRGVCNYCNTAGDPSRLAHIGFAGKVCPTCDTKALRDKIEFPGWYN